MDSKFTVAPEPGTTVHRSLYALADFSSIRVWDICRQGTDLAAEVLGYEGGTVKGRRHAANHDELDRTMIECRQSLFKISHRDLPDDRGTSGRNLSMNRVALTSCCARSSVERRRFLSTMPKSISRLNTSSTGSKASALGPSGNAESCLVGSFIRHPCERTSIAELRQCRIAHNKLYGRDAEPDSIALAAQPGPD